MILQSEHVWSLRVMERRGRTQYHMPGLPPEDHLLTPEERSNPEQLERQRAEAENKRIRDAALTRLPPEPGEEHFCCSATSTFCLPCLCFLLDFVRVIFCLCFSHTVCGRSLLPLATFVFGIIFIHVSTQLISNHTLLSLHLTC